GVERPSFATEGDVFGEGSGKALVHWADPGGIQMATYFWALTDERYKYVETRDVQQFFDRASDPYETANLISTSSYQTLIDEYVLELASRKEELYGATRFHLESSNAAGDPTGPAILTMDTWSASWDGTNVAGGPFVASRYSRHQSTARTVTLPLAG